MIRAYRFLRDMPKNHEYILDLDRRMRLAESSPVEKKADPRLTIENLAGSPFPPDGRLPIKGIELILEQEKQAGKIPPSFTLDKVINLEFVEKANAELDKRNDLLEELKRVKVWVNKYGY